MSPQNNKKTSNQGLSPAALQYKFQEPQKLQKKDHNENQIIWIANNWAGNDFRWDKKICCKCIIFSVIYCNRKVGYNLLHNLLPHNFNLFFFFFFLPNHLVEAKFLKATKILQHFFEYFPDLETLVLMISKSLQGRQPKKKNKGAI